MKNRLVLVLAAALLLGTGLFLHACSNSLLRNFTDAGLETALDDPLPTPTPRKS